MDGGEAIPLGASHTHPLAARRYNLRGNGLEGAGYPRAVLLRQWHAMDPLEIVLNAV